jgi:hypothetical protein
MGQPRGSFIVLYDPGASNWASRKFSLYIGSLRLPELQTVIDTEDWGRRDSAVQDAGVVSRVTQSHVRRRYPGGPQINVPRVTRRVVTQAATRLSILPGRNVYVEFREDGQDYNFNQPDAPITTLQLTLAGSFPDFLLACQMTATKRHLVRTEAGRAIVVSASAAP